MNLILHILEIQLKLQIRGSKLEVQSAIKNRYRISIWNNIVESLCGKYHKARPNYYSFICFFFAPHIALTKKHGKHIFQTILFKLPPSFLSSTWFSSAVDYIYPPLAQISSRRRE